LYVVGFTVRINSVVGDFSIAKLSVEGFGLGVEDGRYKMS
jgi:hypothetical protein